MHEMCEIELKFQSLRSKNEALLKGLFYGAYHY